jgi:hypothetical protein
MARSKKFFYPLLLSLIGFGAFIGIFIAYDRLNEGFSMYQIHSFLPPCPQYTVELTAEKKEFLEEVLGQPFYYLGKGCQFYVFTSQDGKYVIKFLKQKHLRQWTWLDPIPLPSRLRELLDEKKARRSERVERLFSSCLLAYEELKEETGLLFIHLNRIPVFNRKIIIVDKLGWKHRIALDKYEYCIQIKGEPLEKTFSNLSDEERQTKIEELTALVVARCQKGIQDRDRPFVKNVAYTEHGPIFADFGQFYREPAVCQSEVQEKEVAYRINLLHRWLKDQRF